MNSGVAIMTSVEIPIAISEQSWVDLFSSLDPTIQWAIIWWFIAIFPSLLVAWYSAKSNRKQEKYFKLQQVAEEIITNLWQWQDKTISYDWLIIPYWPYHWDDTRSYSPIDWGLLSNNYRKKTKEQLENDKYLYEYQKFIDKRTLLLDEIQHHHNVVFSRIQVYFSESWLSVVRDKSQKLADLIAKKFLSETDEEKQKFQAQIRNVCTELKDLIISRTKWYGRSRISRFWYYWTEKYK